MVQRKKFDVILRFLRDRYTCIGLCTADHSTSQALQHFHDSTGNSLVIGLHDLEVHQFVVPARLPKPVIGSGGLSSSRFDDDVPEVDST